MEIGVLIPIFALLIPIVAIWTRHQQKMAELGQLPQQAGDSRETANLKGRVQELEERVRVLERIVTDGNDGRKLAAEIEALRTTETGTGSGVPLAMNKERV